MRNLFNRGNQAQGAQQRALAASIATFATHLVNPDLPHPAELLSRIGHKHASLGITADQYPIVHEHLFAAIVEVLGADTVTAEVAEAWDRVYWIMADTLIDMERALYEEAGVAAGDVYRRARVAGRVEDPSGAIAGDGRRPRRDVRAGQYVSVGVTLPDGARQLRQYSLVNTSGSGELTFAVKPAGEVSGWIRDNLRVGDLLDITVPFGDLPAPPPGAPLVLISAGIGITPMLGILEALPADAAGAGAARRPQRGRPTRCGSASASSSSGCPTRRCNSGTRTCCRWTVSSCPPTPRCTCVATTASCARCAISWSAVASTRVHCELFSPNDWLAGKSRRRKCATRDGFCVESVPVRLWRPSRWSEAMWISGLLCGRARRTSTSASKHESGCWSAVRRYGEVWSPAMTCVGGTRSCGPSVYGPLEPTLRDRMGRRMGVVRPTGCARRCRCVRPARRAVGRPRHSDRADRDAYALTGRFDRSPRCVG